MVGQPFVCFCNLMGFWPPGVFPRTVGREADESVQSSIVFVIRVFHVATAHCKPCVAYAGMCM